MKVRCGILVKDHKAEIHERELGKLKPGQVLVKMEACNMCTMDYQQWMGKRESQGYPFAGGHEGAGYVVELGENVTNLKVGDYVTFGHPFCGECEACKRGKTAECEVPEPEFSEDGYRGVRNACFAEYRVSEANNSVVMNPAIPPAEASFVEPLGSVVHGLDKIRVQKGDTVVVIGAGTMGLLNAMTAKAYGAKVIVSGRREKKLSRARALGVTVFDEQACDPVTEVMKLTNGRGADVVIPVAATDESYAQAAAMLKKQGGKFLMFSAGFPIPKLPFTTNEIHYREIEIAGTMAAHISDYYEAARLINTGEIDVKPCLEGKYFPLEKIDDAYAAAAEKGSYRVTVICK